MVEYDAAGNLRINLSTFDIARIKRSGLFFLGPSYDTNGCVVTQGKRLDKSAWMKFNFVSSTQTETRYADLRYSGQCAMYNDTPQCSVTPFAIPEAFRRFPFQYFYAEDNGQTFQMDTYQRDTVKLAFSPVSGEPERNVPNSTFENRFLKERSVAVTNLRVTLPRDSQTQQLLVDLDHLDDVEIYAKHFYASILRTPDCPGCN